MTRVLVVEDDAIMAYDLAQQLAAAGFHAVGPAHSVEEGLELLGRESCDIGVLDVNLGRGRTSEPVALELKRRRIPFIVVSGYASEQHSAVFRAAPLITKPVQISLLVSEIERASGGERPHG